MFHRAYVYVILFILIISTRFESVNSCVESSVTSTVIVNASDVSSVCALTSTAVENPACLKIMLSSSSSLSQVSAPLLSTCTVRRNVRIVCSEGITLLCLNETSSLCFFVPISGIEVTIAGCHVVGRLIHFADKVRSGSILIDNSFLDGNMTTSGAVVLATGFVSSGYFRNVTIVNCGDCEVQSLADRDNSEGCIRLNVDTFNATSLVLSNICGPAINAEYFYHFSLSNSIIARVHNRHGTLQLYGSTNTSSNRQVTVTNTYFSNLENDLGGALETHQANLTLLDVSIVNSTCVKWGAAVAFAQEEPNVTYVLRAENVMVNNTVTGSGGTFNLETMEYTRTYVYFKNVTIGRSEAPNGVISVVGVVNRKTLSPVFVCFVVNYKFENVWIESFTQTNVFTKAQFIPLKSI
eukprot:PhF_6_TR4433/c1_g1_i1/m.6002